ncbi:MAG: c-type cytochrome [Epsilonproteobacteria bacterium]|nr:c-type cytochrome [Campylobacterota bacterium]OIO15966.1 MAG: hypothetical protein AUJ81_05800 [Helicobacteraceae bacterium CG1_02_36_14]PIP10596.1 MAG: hypothetical protein COX50_05135 [Sulfurimonas sp. CG23_combo_of_CG06-09_8_20_14_all_36_33]PIS24328.1 MAG: hypothetical protein COT46_09875 [Sulfurimonas sp. CG08_land_8_20_14_0_20_36_33]PIU36260.1 MAG: hypothetical protein COT05_00165 [Sulfurimonas sp. CG07_land_8_20_14_0_80_36_56]PIV04279.1 MAG: hypothetical protein COS56_05635 [Sulfurimo
MKTLLLSILLSTTIFANDYSEGYNVYKNKCSSCHAEKMSRDQVLKNMHTLKAPPMLEISNRLKQNVITLDDDDDIKRQLIIAFVKEYIDNPSLDYSMCSAVALEKFGVMPSQKGKLSDREKQAVSEWLYDSFEGIKFQ